MNKQEPVSQIMSKHVHTVTPNQTLHEARELMEQYNIRHAPVVVDKALVGILSRTDIMRASWGLTRQEEREHRELLQGISVSAAMSSNPLMVAPHTTIREAAEVFAEMDMSALPVVQNNELVGIVTTTDLIRYLLGQY